MHSTEIALTEIYLFSQQMFLSAYYRLGTVLNSGNVVENQIELLSLQSLE